MLLFDRIKGMIAKGEFANDGSLELAQQWSELLEDERIMESLLSNPAFQKILKSLKADFVSRITTLVDNDPELRAIKRMFIRTVGLSGAKERIREHIESFIENPE